MLFNTLYLALAVFGAIASASPIRPRDFNCNVENVQCCKQVMSQHDAVRELGGLLVLPGDLAGNVGLSCSPLGINALSQCKSTPVCCSQVSSNGLVNAGCTPLSLV